MSKYKLTFKLKQHTPIIHFQYDQHGATLRASELKPKLDKFLIEKYGGVVNLRNKHKSWFINDEKPALDYKVKIVPMETQSLRIDKKSKLPGYFANMGSDYTPKALSISKDDIELIIIVFNDELKQLIDDYIEEFFLIHNFGTRQSKGFGSFTLANKNITNKYFDAYFEVTKPSHIPWKSDIYKDDWSKIIDTFGNIDIFYRSLRSGINRKSHTGTMFYIKPAIFYYSWYKLNKQWDKKSIKEHYLNKDLRNQIHKHVESDILSYSDTEKRHILIKDVFGLSSLESWMSYNNSVTKSHETIDRFKSPILFKPYQKNGVFYIGIKCFEVDKDFLNQTFDIEFGKSKGLQLKTPKSFDWSDFWNYYFNKLPSLDDRCYSDNNRDKQFEYQILRNNKLTKIYLL